ncbi:Peptidase, ArgE/DapE family [uncultured Desulfobacterium sp.]|uniref:Peptidase, ArgE/DapE family n=1 Tax=uncultured Desulfobacterium sp. TaxID=201089 RepID=A0A445MZI6_9BACT|nr:Peptidase, ArgE/DapE family [uncultured Desulfobacterium sp.]
MTELKKLFERIDGYGNDVERLQSALTSRVAMGPDNGGTGEHEKAAFTDALLKELDPDFIKELRAPDQRAHGGYRPNLVARWDGSQPCPAVWVLSHLDVVPPGDLALWEGDPFEVRVEGDKIFGRGVEDNQHGFVSSYLAIKAILDSGLKPKRSVGLAVVADEETGSRYGLQYVLGHHKGLFNEQDLIIVPDGGNEDGTMVEVAEKSMLWIKFTVTGRQCHGSTPAKGKNSLVGAARLILALEGLKDQFNISDKLYKPSTSTFAPTKIEANVPNVNTIPGRDVFYMDCRVLPRYGVDEVIGASRKIAAKTARELDLKIDVEPVHREDAAPPTSLESQVVVSLSKAIKKVTGKKAKPVGIGGGTVAAFFRKAGLPAAVWCTQSDTAHQPNEFTLISSILTDSKIFACLYMGEE